MFQNRSVKILGFGVESDYKKIIHFISRKKATTSKFIKQIKFLISVFIKYGNRKEINLFFWILQIFHLFLGLGVIYLEEGYNL